MIWYILEVSVKILIVVEYIDLLSFRVSSVHGSQSAEESYRRYDFS